MQHIQYKRALIGGSILLVFTLAVFIGVSYKSMADKNRVLESDNVITAVVKIDKINDTKFEGHITEPCDAFSVGDKISVEYDSIENAPVDNLEETQIGNTVSVFITKSELKTDPHNVKALHVKVKPKEYTPFGEVK